MRTLKIMCTIFGRCPVESPSSGTIENMLMWSICLNLGGNWMSIPLLCRVKPKCVHLIHDRMNMWLLRIINLDLCSCTIPELQCLCHNFTAWILAWEKTFSLYLEERRKDSCLLYTWTILLWSSGSQKAEKPNDTSSYSFVKRQRCLQLGSFWIHH